jgi:gamma-resorcylate decarboxylase
MGVARAGAVLKTCVKINLPARRRPLPQVCCRKWAGKGLGRTMQGKIALEEHFAIAETLSDSRGYFPDRVWEEVKSRVLDIQDRRLREMDQQGIEMTLLSLNAPAVQAISDKARAAEIARKANDYLAAQVQQRPDRFQGLAALAMQDPDGAARELERCVKEFGFRGALVNGFSQVGDAETIVYYDLPQYRPFWAMVERLDVPFYLHPRNPLPRDAKIYDAIPGSWVRSGLSATRPRCMRCA